MKKLLLILVLGGAVALIWHYKPSTQVFGANTAISGLTSYTTPISGDILPINDTVNATTKKVTVDNLFNMLSSLFRVKDSTDTTKKVAFGLSGITTATTRTWTFPDADDTFVGLTGTQTLTNKNITMTLSTSTNATTTSLFATTTVFINATTTNFYASGKASTTALYLATGPCVGSNALQVSAAGLVGCASISSGGVSNFSTTTTSQLATSTITSALIPTTNTLRLIVQIASTTAAGSVTSFNQGNNNLHVAFNNTLAANTYRSRIVSYPTASTIAITQYSDNDFELAKWNLNRLASSTVTLIMDISNITGQQKTATWHVFSGGWDETMDNQEGYVVFNDTAKITQIDIWYEQGQAATIYMATSTKFTLYGI